MNSTSLNTWLDTLRAVAPMQGALLVGAGTGAGPLVQWLRQAAPEHACLVEADETTFQYLQRHPPGHPGWTQRRAMVTPDAEPIRFNRFNNPAENGLLPASALQSLWPNLHSIDPDYTGEPQAGITLASLLAETAGPANWLLLDCLPAAPLLQGAGSALGRLDAILVRVVVNESLAEPSARHATVKALLKNAGFHCIHLESERHPALALALYVRDIRTALAEKQNRIEQLEAGLSDLGMRAKLHEEELGKAEKQLLQIDRLLRETLS